MGAAVKVDCDTEIRAGRVPHRLHLLQQPGDGAAVVDPADTAGAEHLDIAKALRFFFKRGFCAYFRGVRIDPGIDLHLFTDAPAEQFVDRHAERLALDVPKRLIDSGERACQHRPAAIKSAAVDCLPDVLDVAWIGAQQIRLQFVDTCLCGGGASLHNWLAPSDQSVVRFQPQQQPARPDAERFNLSQLHSETPVSWILSGSSAPPLKVFSGTTGSSAPPSTVMRVPVI